MAGDSRARACFGRCVRRWLAGEPVRYQPPIEAVGQIDHFLETLSLETTDLRAIEPRLVRLCHALDHLNQLHEDLSRMPSNVSGGQAPAAFKAGPRALTAWLVITKDPRSTSDLAIFKAIEDASKQLSAECKTGRDKILGDLALQRLPAEKARNSLEELAWADGALYHAWRLVESLRIAADGQSTTAAIRD